MKREVGQMVEILDKDKNLLGSYTFTEVSKPDTYIVSCINKAGQEITITKEITKKDVTALLTQAFNTNVRNYVAGLARPSKPSKLKAYEEYFAEKGIDVTGIDTDKLIAKLKELT